MIEVSGLYKTYAHGGRPVAALRDVHLSVAKGSCTALMGSSGCGKSTLLNIIGGIDTPSSGTVSIHGRERKGRNESELALLRRREVGLIFQFFNLMPTMSVQENVALPALLDARPSGFVMERAAWLLKEVGLDHRLDHMPHELSGGEMQRTAIARALINEPSVILADEPTGNLDSSTAAHVLEVLLDVVRRNERTLLVATHSHELASRVDRVVHMKDGAILDA
ncbi:MAG: ABC transporter ATP-binding protein [Bacteroidetes bacterium]|nr:ABC transporter ATP-binding protein [Bacteroidota bacterium]